MGASTSNVTGADLYDAVVVTCTNGCTISASGVGTCPDVGSKVVGNWIFGTQGMLTYGGAAGSDNVENESVAAAEASRDSGARLQYCTNDGTHVNGPAFEFEHLDPDSTG